MVLKSNIKTKINLLQLQITLMMSHVWQEGGREGGLNQTSVERRIKGREMIPPCPINEPCLIRGGGL